MFHFNHHFLNKSVLADCPVYIIPPFIPDLSVSSQKTKTFYILPDITQLGLMLMSSISKITQL